MTPRDLHIEILRLLTAAHRRENPSSRAPSITWGVTMRDLLSQTRRTLDAARAQYETAHDYYRETDKDDDPTLCAIVDAQLAVDRALSEVRKTSH
jgi:hypothetical protein